MDIENGTAKPLMVNDIEENRDEKVSKNNSDDSPVRETWDRKLDFMLSCIGYAVGLGNIWRFPYLCYKNGGGAFLIPYLIFLLICGIPLFFLELSFGQFGALGPVAIWKIAPLFKGVGYAMMMISFMVCVYYNVIIAYSLHFIFSSMQSVLPWSKCGNVWNTDFCRDKIAVNGTTYLAPEWTNISCGKGEGWFNTSTTFVQSLNLTVNGSCVNFTTSAQEYFTRRVLRLTDNIDEMGGIQWEIFGYLLLAWVIVFICLFKGVKWSGKIVYFTATFPYVVLLILLIRGVMEEGAMLGIRYYLLPKFERLFDIKVWIEAAVQIFYSLGAAYGVILSYSSLNNFKNNVYRDAVTICCVNCATSILAGLVVFTVLGSLAYQTDKDITQVVDEGAGLAFVAYPSAVANLPISPLWAFLFFFMLLNLGLDSQFGMIEAVVKGLLDEFSIFRRNKVKFLAGLCVVQFLLALPMVTESGIYWLTVIDWYCAGLSLMVVALLEILCIAWVYGADRFIYDISCMIGKKPLGWQFWKVMWCYVTPFCILCLLLANLINYSSASYNEVKFPLWADCVGWMTSFASILMIPSWGVYQLYTHPRAQGSCLQRIKALLKHDEDWGPREQNIPYKYRKEVITLSILKKDDTKTVLEPLHCCKDNGSSSSIASDPETPAKSDPPSYSDANLLA